MTKPISNEDKLAKYRSRLTEDLAAILALHKAGRWRAMAHRCLAAASNANKVADKAGE